MSQSAGLRIDATADGLAFWIHVTPRSKRPAVGGLHGDALRVAVAEPPRSGKANRACEDAIAEALGCSRRAVEIDPGAKNRRKRVHVAEASASLRSRLDMLAQDPGLG